MPSSSASKASYLYFIIDASIPLKNLSRPTRPLGNESMSKMRKNEFKRKHFKKGFLVS